VARPLDERYDGCDRPVLRDSPGSAGLCPSFTIEAVSIAVAGARFLE
jgi:hypothetical protein